MPLRKYVTRSTNKNQEESQENQITSKKAQEKLEENILDELLKSQLIKN